MAADCNMFNGQNPQELGVMAYNLADAMIAEKARRDSQKSKPVT
jgi:hypothetical protein